jgi:hypothetical protein
MIVVCNYTSVDNDMFSMIFFVECNSSVPLLSSIYDISSKIILIASDYILVFKDDFSYLNVILLLLKLIPSLPFLSFFIQQIIDPDRILGTSETEIKIMFIASICWNAFSLMESCDTTKALE